MDEVLEKLETTLISRETDENSKTSFDGLYKNWGRLGNQEERRKQLLDVQKGNRNNKLDNFRGIIELVNAVEDRDIFKSQNNRSYYRPSIYVAGFTKASASYNNVLMMSEWMVEKPEDFNDNWYVTPCPKGVRMLVVANQGKTKCYTKYGQFRNECKTALPGGNPCEPGYKNRCCVLDCFYDDKTNTMFILDLLAWNCQPMTDGETEFRNYWLQTNLGDMPEIKSVTKKNKLIFKILPKTPCTPELFNQFMMKYPHFENFHPALDGLLFYHKRAHYIGGETPLVGWLFPYMVPEVLGAEITVNLAYIAEKPNNYVNQADFIQKFEEKMSKRCPQTRRRHNSAMDTTPVKTDHNSESIENQTEEKSTAQSTPRDDMDADEKPSTRDTVESVEKDDTKTDNTKKQEDTMEN